MGTAGDERLGESLNIEFSTGAVFMKIVRLRGNGTSFCAFALSILSPAFCILNSVLSKLVLLFQINHRFHGKRGFLCTTKARRTTKKNNIEDPDPSGINHKLPNLTQRPAQFYILNSKFEIPFHSSLLDTVTASIIEHRGFDNSEAATSQFVRLCFMSRS